MIAWEGDAECMSPVGCLGEQIEEFPHPKHSSRPNGKCSMKSATIARTLNSSIQARMHACGLAYLNHGVELPLDRSGERLQRGRTVLGDIGNNASLQHILSRRTSVARQWMQKRGARKIWTPPDEQAKLRTSTSSNTRRTASPRTTSRQPWLEQKAEGRGNKQSQKASACACPPFRPRDIRAGRGGKQQPICNTEAGSTPSVAVESGTPRHTTRLRHGPLGETEAGDDTLRQEMQQYTK